MNSRIDLTLQQREADEAELAKRTLAHKRRVGSSAELSSASNVARRRRRAQQLSNRQRSGLPGDRRLVVRLPARRKRSVAVEHGDRRSTHADREPAAARSQLRALRPGDDRGPDLREPAAHHRCRVGLEPVGQRRAGRDPGFDGRRRPGRGPVRHLSGLPGSGLDAARLQGALDSVAASYNDLFELRKIIAPNTPIIGHCYDYAIPNGAAPICAGPWLQPSLEFAGYDLAEGLNIVSAIIDSFLHDAEFARRRREKQLCSGRHEKHAGARRVRSERLGERASSVSAGFQPARAEILDRAAKPISGGLDLIEAAERTAHSLLPPRGGAKRRMRGAPYPHPVALSARPLSPAKRRKAGEGNHPT